MVRREREKRCSRRRGGVEGSELGNGNGGEDWWRNLLGRDDENGFVQFGGGGRRAGWGWVGGGGAGKLSHTTQMVLTKRQVDNLNPRTNLVLQ